MPNVGQIELRLVSEGQDVTANFLAGARGALDDGGHFRREALWRMH